MPVVSLSIERFRNLAPVSLRFSPQLNLFIGPNAAGKTSLLECLFVLARARSFRTRSLAKAVQAGESGFQLVANVETSQNRQIPVGLRCSEEKLVARMDGRPVSRLSELAGLVPVQWLGGNLHRLIEEGPVHRRQYLDWGLFHVKPAYGEVWKRFQKLLKQRNAALRAGVSAREINAWDHELASSGEELHNFRQVYLRKLAEAVKSVSRELLGLDEEIQVIYRKGWAPQLPYIEALRTGSERDREHRYTRSGPQRAEMAFLYQGRPTVETFSRGQQKLLVLALQVAQASLLRQETLRTSVFLMDDLGAELDAKNQQRVMRLLHAIEAQAFVTAIDDPGVSHWNMDSVRRFHVKHGSVSEVLYSPS
jgi:DNA replication and repair protein RecF